MKFINIPKNGASWGGELCYSFATELDQPSDVQVIVRDAETDAEIGRLKLYAITEATVDIAPIVRRRVSDEPQIAIASEIVPSRAMCRVIVEVEGVRSPTITLFRASYNPVILPEQEQLLSPIRKVIELVLGVDASSLEIVNRPPTRSKPQYMRIWEARKADGLDYDESDPEQQQFLASLGKTSNT